MPRPTGWLRGSKRLLAKALSRGRRDKAIIAKIVGLEWRDGEVFSSELKDSLRRLKTEVIDLYQAHWPDESLRIE